MQLGAKIEKLWLFHDTAAKSVSDDDYDVIVMKRQCDKVTGNRLESRVPVRL